MLRLAFLSARGRLGAFTGALVALSLAFVGRARPLVPET